jgi:hypothetical protein
MLTTAQLLTLAHPRHSQEGEIGSIQAREGRMSIRPWAAGNVISNISVTDVAFSRGCD